MQTAPSRRRYTFYARERNERKRQNIPRSQFVTGVPLSWIFRPGRYVGPRSSAVLTPKRAVQHVDGDRRVKDSPFLFPSHPSGTHDGPTFDLYRPLSIFCNLLLRILNVRIVSAEGSRVRRGANATPATAAAAAVETRSRSRARGIRNITNSSFCYRPRRGEMPP